MSELKFSEKWEAFRLEKEITQETFVSSGYSFVDDLEEFVKLQIDEHDLKNSLNKCFDDLFLQKHLEQELAKLTNKFEKAKKYIELSPCDPDIYPDQLEAWNQYQEAIKND